MPKVRNPKETQEKDIEAYANRSHDTKRERGKKRSRICISLFREELEKLRALAEEDGRSISSFIRMQLLKSLNDPN